MPQDLGDVRELVVQLGTAMLAAGEPLDAVSLEYLNSGQDPLQGLDDAGFIARAAGKDREVEVLGEAIGLDEALLEARPTLEDPSGRKRGVGTDAPQHPAKGVVLLHHFLAQSLLEDALHDRSPADHARISALMLRFHLVRIEPSAGDAECLDDRAEALEDRAIAEALTYGSQNGQKTSTRNTLTAKNSPMIGRPSFQ